MKKYSKGKVTINRDNNMGNMLTIRFELPIVGGGGRIPKYSIWEHDRKDAIKEATKLAEQIKSLVENELGNSLEDVDISESPKSLALFMVSDDFDDTKEFDKVITIK